MRMEADKVNQNKCFIDSRICGLHFQSIHIDAPTRPPVILILEVDFMPAATWREWRGEKICYPSHKTTFVCLPGPSKPLTRLGSAQRQWSLSSLPLSPSFYPPLPLPHRSLLFCSSSFASTMQTFSGLSAPPLLRQLWAQNLLIQTAVAAHRGTTQQTEFNAEINATLLKADFFFTPSPLNTRLASSQPALVPTLCYANGDK